MDDLIRRGALLGKLDELSEFFRRRSETEDKGFLAVQCGVAFAIEEVKEAPSVDAVEVVHARWVEKEYVIDDEIFEAVVCGECEANRVAGIGLAKYCYDCGCRMDGEEEKDDDVQRV